MAPSARIRVIGEGFTTVQCQAVARIAARHLFLRSLVDAQHDVDGRVAIGVHADLPARCELCGGRRKAPPRCSPECRNRWKVPEEPRDRVDAVCRMDPMESRCWRTDQNRMP